jgi:hypothetical protein
MLGLRSPAGVSKVCLIPKLAMLFPNTAQTAGNNNNNGRSRYSSFDPPDSLASSTVSVLKKSKRWVSVSFCVCLLALPAPPVHAPGSHMIPGLILAKFTACFCLSQKLGHDNATDRITVSLTIVSLIPTMALITAVSLMPIMVALIAILVLLAA